MVSLKSLLDGLKLLCLLHFILLPALLALDFLQPEEFLPVLFIQLGPDIADGVLQSGQDNVLKSIDSSIRGLYDIIKDKEGSLMVMMKRGKINLLHYLKGSQLDQ